MTICRECKMPLQTGALRCQHCTARQNWRRYLDGGALMVTSLLALVSIWAAQPIKDFFDAKKADINVSILKGDSLQTVFMLSNTGTRPAGLSRIEIQSMSRDTSWYLYSDLDNQLIEPGKAYVLHASNGAPIPSAMSHEEQAMLTGKKVGTPNCNLVVQYVQMSGTKEYKYFPFLCVPADIDLLVPNK